jgi:hypothetical protein
VSAGPAAPLDAELPVLCRRCGGPCEPDAELRITCPFCGLSDRLPAEIGERTRELRTRLRQAARAAMQLDGFQRSLAGLYETPGVLWKALAPMVMVPAAILVYEAVQYAVVLGNMTATVRRQVSGEILGGALSGAMMLAFMPLAMAAGMLIARRAYRRRVRPLLLGRPPRQPGRPARCRSCGGELADGRGPFVTCRYCGTSNLLGEELRRDSARLLAEEQAALRQQAQRALGAGARAANAHPIGRALLRSGVGVYVALIVLNILVRKVYALFVP